MVVQEVALLYKHMRSDRPFRALQYLDFLSCGGVLLTFAQLGGCLAQL